MCKWNRSTKMTPFFISLYVLTFLQCDFIAPPFKKWNLFYYPLSLGWPCDLLWSAGCGRSDRCQFQAYDSGSLVCFSLSLSLPLSKLPPPQAQLACQRTRHRCTGAVWALLCLIYLDQQNWTADPQTCGQKQMFIIIYHCNGCYATIFWQSIMDIGSDPGTILESSKTYEL